MLMFLVAAALMVAAALIFLLLPLLKRLSANSRAGRYSEVDLIALYRQQISEMEVDVAAGLLPRNRLDEARRELETRLLSEVPRHPVGAHARWSRSRLTAAVVTFVLPLAAGLLYWQIGSPGALTAAARSAASVHAGAQVTSADQIEAMVNRLAGKLAANPDNPDGWAMLARSYGVLGRHREAAAAFARAAALQPDDAELLADYADALAMTGNGKLTGKPMQLVRRALHLDPDNPKALALAGTEAFDRADYRGAEKFWEHAVRTASQGTEFTDALRASIEEARSLAAGKAEISPPGRASEVPRNAADGVAGSVFLAKSLAAKASPGDAVFIFARAQNGPRMPLAILTAKVKDLPMDFLLDDSLSMSPGMKLSSFERVFVTARISRAGSATLQPGDLQGSVGPVRVGTNNIRIDITEIAK